MSIVFKNECASCIDTPLCNKTTMYVDNCDGAVKVINNNGCVNTISCGISVCDIPTDNCQLSNSCGYFKGLDYPGCGSLSSGRQAPSNGFLFLKVTGGQHYSNPYNILNFSGGGLSITLPSQKNSDQSDIVTIPVKGGVTYTWSGGSESGYQHSSSVSALCFLPFSY